MKESRYEKAALLVRARKQLKNWQCYLRAVAELEGSVASGEYSNEPELEQSMAASLSRYATRPKEAKSCFVEMAGNGLPCSLVGRIVMTHKNLKLKESRANKLLVKLYEEAFEVILQGFYTTTNSKWNINYRCNFTY